MSTFLRFARVFALGAWVGAIIYFAAVVAPEAFTVLASRDEAGAIVRCTLARLHLFGAIAAAIYLIASLALEKSWRALVKPAALGVILMLLLTLASRRIVMPRMAELRVSMRSVDATPPSDPRRVQFDRLHTISVDIEGGVLAVGLIALFLTLRET
jgi:Domain of unknown function (DUF4149)